MKKKQLVVTLIAAGVGALLIEKSRKKYLRWGATDEEINAALPGDEFMHHPASTRAVTIQAPVEEVWQWLVQIGQDRGGFYSYDWLERMVGAGITNVDRIVPEWQTLSTGDYVRLASSKMYGDLPLLKVLAIEKNSHLVLEHWGAFVLKPIGSKTTRFLIRTHGETKPFHLRLMDLFIEPIHFVMERKMLLGIQERAERSGAKPLPSRMSAA